MVNKNQSNKTKKGECSVREINFEEGLDEQLIFLNFGARLLTAFTDRKLLINIALETIADFSKSKRVAVLILDKDSEKLSVEGLLVNNKPYQKNKVISLEDPFLKHVLSSKIPRFYSLRMNGKVPVPSDSRETTNKKCLCLPLVDSSFEVIGLVVIESPKKDNLSFQDLQQLFILSTLFSISLQNSLLFSQILYDGLTGLFVRKYYDIRINEELLKLKRHPGSIAIILIDIDHFKTINDSYGHQVGDRVLVEFSNILKENVRKGTSMVSRYDGEKFIILMSDTPLNGALIVADRIRSLCSGYNFADAHNLQVTVSAGIASTDNEGLIAAEELFRRADAMLYKAKQSGRNQTMVWVGSDS
ncbi:MAG: sensor domain-containing diguanylate cyclase [Proteobacteria bacterium]|nr:sensor domain-containing diguanylate cyclase [Pseudomonadota bacterium]